MRELIHRADNGEWCVRAWIKTGPLRCYVRITERVLGGSKERTIDLASFEMHPNKRGKGYFTQWLEWVEETGRDTGRIVFIESVVNPRLEQFLIRRGYVACGITDLGDSYYLPQAKGTSRANRTPCQHL